MVAEEHSRGLEGSGESGEIPNTPRAASSDSIHGEIPEGWELRDKDIRITTHLNACKAVEMHRFLDYQPGLSADYDLNSINKEPWRPFRTRPDIEIAELAQDARMNKKQTQRLIKLIQECVSKPKSFTIIDEPDLSKTWEEARKVHVPNVCLSNFCKVSIAHSHLTEDISYEMMGTPLMSWVDMMMSDQALLPQCQFDAVKVEQYNGGAFDRRYNEPWTGEAWWEAQSALPNGAGVFAIILNADKTSLSTFGTQKAYPIYARCGNLPLRVRNGIKHGKEVMVGLMPVVYEHVDAFSQAEYPNFKQEVWVKAFLEILKSIASEFATTGKAYSIEAISRWLYPFIIILASDYEEQCIMAMIRGIKGLFPCPVCLVPREEQSDLSKSWRLRTTPWMQQVFMDTVGMTKEGRNNVLKGYGLRAVENAFWSFELSDVYSALTWDRLHAYHIGLFRDHLMKEISRILAAYFGSQGAAQVDANLNNSPRWPGLTHFSTLSTLGEIADASKFEDLSKVILFAIYPLFATSKENNSEPYHLLMMLRSYLDLDLFASLRNPSQKLIREGEALLQEFYTRSKKFLDVTTNTDKDWNFPKFHSHTHMFRDICRKGATVNGNCKTFERAHRPVRLNYQLRTNFKNVNVQVYCCFSFDSEWDEILAELEALRKEAELDDSAEGGEWIVPDYPHISFGSRERQPSPISDIIAKSPAEFKAAFQNLNRKIADRLSEAGIAQSHIHSFPVSQEIREYHLIRVEYESLDDWARRTDLIRSHTKFHGHERHNCLMYQVTNSTVSFGRLLLVFTVTYNGVAQHLALVTLFDLRPSVTNRARDANFDLIRVRQRAYSDSIVIHVGPILRAACLTPAWDCDFKDEYILNCFWTPTTGYDRRNCGTEALHGEDS
ncbi:hypothetical protein FA15DRAFT_599615 [Coprinopsis marcescibilis]|uniref:Uncharacterized protein n=1 Tax=Coprinopsis marcescibilis TaxID=230819 RepID=A0A5C3KX45_COPMA|nr:hypothetical protein FA15DRAFT_599615 [Coprinopsis marcescibilis]